MNSTTREILERNISLHGADNQALKCIEEMGELTQYLVKAHLYPHRSFKQEITEEIADVKITLMQMEMVYGQENVDAMVQFKLERVQKRNSDT